MTHLIMRVTVGESKGESKGENKGESKGQNKGEIIRVSGVGVI